MSSIIVFRCHSQPSVCADRVHLLRHYNPDAPLFGLFGGTAELAPVFHSTIGHMLEHWYETKRTPEWNWRHGDLALRRWYLDVGFKIDFDRLYLVEWDLILLDSLENLYAHVPKEAVAVTARFPLNEVEHNWGWMTNDADKQEWEVLLEQVTKEYDYKNEPFASLGAGTCYPRAFLEKYSDIEIPELTNDEQRVPLFTQCFHIPLFDTGFCTFWDDPDQLRFFNCQKREIDASTIRAELQRPNGRRTFHPFTQASSEVFCIAGLKEIKSPLSVNNDISDASVQCKYDCIFISPHLDDAVLSCGGYIALQIQEGATILIVTVAAGDPPTGSFSQLAKKAHELWGLNSNAMKVRRHEDSEACGILGVQYIHFSLPDCIYRRDNVSGKHYYQTQADIFGPPNPHDILLVSEIAQLLGSLPQCKKSYAPLSVGNHVDHVLTRLAAEAVFADSLTYYEEFPYCSDSASLTFALQQGVQLFPWIQTLSSSCLETKISAVKAHLSQLGPVFGNPEQVDERLEKHFSTVGGERFWSASSQGRQ